MEELIGLSLAILVGISLGLIGSGGSILTVPILVYVMSVPPSKATVYSLFIVGISAIVGGIKNAMQNNVNFLSVFIFGIPSVISVFLTRAYLVPMIPDNFFSIGSFVITKDIFIMGLFATLMILASYNMIVSKVVVSDENHKLNIPLLFVQGLFVGLLTGLVGVGGGFLIIPALVFFAKIPMKAAVGTSLVIIAINSMFGFFVDYFKNPDIDFPLILSFSMASMIGMFIGIYLTKKIDGAKLKTSFGWFVLIMGVYILAKEFYLK